MELNGLAHMLIYFDQSLFETCYYKETSTIYFHWFGFDIKQWGDAYWCYVTSYLHLVIYARLHVFYSWIFLAHLYQFCSEGRTHLGV